MILGITLAYSCSSSSDSNGNSTTTVVPVAPSSLTGTITSSTEINLTWTDNSNNETGFKIERKIGSGAYAVVGTVAANITTFNDTGLAPSTAYTYKVCATNSAGNSVTYSNELLKTTNNLNQSETMLVGSWQYYVSPHPSFPNVPSSFYKSYFVFNQDKSGTIGFEDSIPNQPTSGSNQITWSATSSVITVTFPDNTTDSRNYIVIDQTHISVPDNGVQHIYTKI